MHVAKTWFVESQALPVSEPQAASPASKGLSLWHLQCDKPGDKAWPRRTAFAVRTRPCRVYVGARLRSIYVPLPLRGPLNSTPLILFTSLVERYIYSPVHYFTLCRSKLK
jgi:hypothetical protein